MIAIPFANVVSMTENPVGVEIVFTVIADDFVLRFCFFSVCFGVVFVGDFFCILTPLFMNKLYHESKLLQM
jgi:hypothetical protein